MISSFVLQTDQMKLIETVNVTNDEIVTFWLPEDTNQQTSQRISSFGEWLLKTMRHFIASGALNACKMQLVQQDCDDDLRTTVRWSSGNFPKAFAAVLLTFFRDNANALHDLQSLKHSVRQLAAQVTELQIFCDCVERHVAETAADLLGFPGSSRQEATTLFFDMFLDVPLARFTDQLTHSCKVFMNAVGTTQQQLFPITVITAGMHLAAACSDGSPARLRNLEAPLRSIILTARVQNVSMLCLPLGCLDSATLNSVFSVLEYLLQQDTASNLTCIALSVGDVDLETTVLPSFAVPLFVAYSDLSLLNVVRCMSDSGICHCGVVCFDNFEFAVPLRTTSNGILSEVRRCTNYDLITQDDVDFAESLNHIIDESDDVTTRVVKLQAWAPVVPPIEGEILAMPVTIAS